MRPKAGETRKASKEELAQGAEEILEAHLRMESQRQNEEELPIEDRKPTKKTATSSKQSAEGARRKTRNETSQRAPRESSPMLTVQVKPEGGSTSTELRTPKQQAKREGKKEDEDEEEKQQQRLGSAKEGEKGIEEGGEGKSGLGTLFTPEQLQHMNQIYEQAPWLYGTSQSVLTPLTSTRKPPFLEQEETKTGGTEKESKEALAQFEIWRSAVKDQREREELRRALQEVVKENVELKKKLDEMDGRLNRGDQYLTPDSQRRVEQDEDEEEEQQKSESGEEQPEEKVGSHETDFTKQSRKFMLLMMETMKEFQRSIGGSKEEGVVRGVEVVRTGVPDLPPLSQWDAQTGPLQLGDWILLVEPIVSDLSVTANEWWKLMVEAAEDWYRQHIAMSPLERVKHDTSPPKKLTEEKWQRVERRTAAMLLQAVPSSVRDELVSARRMRVFGILTLPDDELLPRRSFRETDAVEELRRTTRDHFGF